MTRLSNRSKLRRFLPQTCSARSFFLHLEPWMFIDRWSWMNQWSGRSWDCLKRFRECTVDDGGMTMTFPMNPRVTINRRILFVQRSRRHGTSWHDLSARNGKILAEFLACAFHDVLQAFGIQLSEYHSRVRLSRPPVCRTNHRNRR